MAIEFRLPDLGENIESGDVVNVLVREGEVIAANQAVVEVETDKAVVEVPCPHAGRIVSLHVKKGDTIPVGGPILSLETTLTADSSPPPTAPRPTPPPAPAAPPRPSAPVAAAPTTVTAPRVPAAPEPAPPTEAVAAAPARPAPADDEPAPVEAAPTAPAAPTTASDGAPSSVDTVAAGPAIRRLARELGIELANVIGTGAGGRITREDVIAAVRQVTRVVSAPSTPGVPAAPKPAPPPPGVTDQDPWGGIRHEKLTKIRKTIAANMVRSSTTIPHVTNFDDADITELERIRKGSAADYAESNVKLTMMVFVMKAVAHALKLHPVLNASLNMEQEEVIYKEYVNLGIAVDTERGLVVPVVRNVDRLTLPQIAYALSEVTKKARASQFTLEDLRGGTFTISNLGAVGGAYSTPIINHPEVAVLLVGRSRKLPVVTDDNKIEIRLMMPLSLSYDHRLVDGAAAARFLNEVIDFLQAPGRLLLAP